MSSTSPRPSKNGCEQLQSRRNTRGAADRPVCYLDHPNKTVFLDPLNYTGIIIISLAFVSWSPLPLNFCIHFSLSSPHLFSTISLTRSHTLSLSTRTSSFISLYIISKTML
ncbi:hypothetical protein ACMYSQ_005517 [Aspergillus niger]